MLLCCLSVELCNKACSCVHVLDLMDDETKLVIVS